MTRSLVLAPLLALPSLAFAHGGHDHAFSPTVHHLAEGAIVVGLIAAVATVAGLIARSRKSTRPSWS